MLAYNAKLKPIARDLRKNMTDSERLLWSKLRRKQLKNLQFYRQRIIGNYIVDFYCHTASLIVELDGSQHYTDIGKVRDTVRDDYFKRLGIRILRFSNAEVFKDLNSILKEIWRNL